MNGARKRARREYLFVAALISCAGNAAAQTGATWEQSGGTPQGTRYSRLKDITVANAATMTEEFSFATGTIGAHQGGPLVVGTTMYVVTPWPNKLIALDLTNSPASAVPPSPCGPTGGWRIPSNNPYAISDNAFIPRRTTPESTSPAASKSSRFGVANR